MSVAMWIYPQYVINVNGRIMSKKGKAQTSVHFFVPDISFFIKADWNTDSGFEINWNPTTTRLTFTGSGSTVAYAEGVQLTHAVWHHIAFVASGNSVKIYVNGTDVTKKSVINPVTTNTLDLFFGRQSGKNKNFYVGRIDECYLFTR